MNTPNPPARTPGDPVLPLDPEPPAAPAPKLVPDAVLEHPEFPFAWPASVATQTLEARRAALAKGLLDSGIDPELLDVLLAHEIDRRQKTRFGIVFVTLAAAFTAAAYAIVVLNGVLDWKIPEAAITGLVIETPLQFIGLLYIVAYNLFPKGKSLRVKALHSDRAANNGLTERPVQRDVV